MFNSCVHCNTSLHSCSQKHKCQILLSVMLESHSSLDGVIPIATGSLKVKLQLTYILLSHHIQLKNNLTLQRQCGFFFTTTNTKILYKYSRSRGEKHSKSCEFFIRDKIKWIFPTIHYFFFFSFYTLFIDNLLMLELLQLKKFQDLLIHALKLIRNSTLSSTHCQNYLQKLH